MCITTKQFRNFSNSHISTNFISNPIFCTHGNYIHISVILIEEISMEQKFHLKKINNNEKKEGVASRFKYYNWVEPWARGSWFDKKANKNRKKNTDRIAYCWHKLFMASPAIRKQMKQNERNKKNEQKNKNEFEGATRQLM